MTPRGATWAWLGACVAAFVISAVLALTTGWGGNVAFVAGAITILASVGFIGMGGETRFRVIRNLFGHPVAVEQQDPEKRRKEISTGVKVFLVGLAIWAPLIYLALR